MSYIKCIYEIKDNNNYIQIINNRGETIINEEIESKVKIWNNGKKENLIFKKKFNTKGKHIIYFIIEKPLNNMMLMFNNCSSLKEINFISFQTNNVINMKGMFQECNELEYLDLSNFNTSNVTDMGWMFYKCNNLKEIKGINNFNTSKVTNMKAMFQDCYELEYLDLSNFNISNVEDMEAMFNNCHKLKEIKGINNFDLTNIDHKDKIFDGCNNLKELIFSKFNVKIGNNIEKHIFVIFSTIDLKIQHLIPCYTSDIFTTIEDKLYAKYPELKKKNIYFTVDGITINKSDTLENNNIKSSTDIFINYYSSNN